MKISKKSINTTKENIVQVYLVILIILASGNIYGSYIYYKEFIYILFISSLLINKLKPLNKKNVIIGLLLSSIILFNYFIWMSNVDGYFALILKIISTILLVNNIKAEKFKKIFIFFFFFYCFISLISYFILLNDWNIVKTIPIREIWGKQMRPTLFYTFPSDEFYRNFGFYREGGMYAIILNIALFLTYRTKNIKVINLMRVTFIITIATTLSTTGMIGAILIIIFSNNLSKITIKNIFFSIILLVVILIIENNIGIISNKFTYDNTSFTERSSEVQVILNIIDNKFFTGVGYQNNIAIERYSGRTMTNSFLSLFSDFGVLFGGILLIIYINGIFSNFRCSKDKILVLILFILFSSSQPVIFSVLFLILVFKVKIE